MAVLNETILQRALARERVFTPGAGGTQEGHTVKLSENIPEEEKVAVCNALRGHYGEAAVADCKRKFLSDFSREGLLWLFVAKGGLMLNVRCLTPTVLPTEEQLSALRNGRGAALAEPGLGVPEDVGRLLSAYSLDELLENVDICRPFLVADKEPAHWVNAAKVLRTALRFYTSEVRTRHRDRQPEAAVEQGEKLKHLLRKLADWDTAGGVCKDGCFNLNEAGILGGKAAWEGALVYGAPRRGDSDSDGVVFSVAVADMKDMTAQGWNLKKTKLIREYKRANAIQAGGILAVCEEARRLGGEKFNVAVGVLTCAFLEGIGARDHAVEDFLADFLDKTEQTGVEISKRVGLLRDFFDMVSYAAYDTKDETEYHPTRNPKMDYYEAGLLYAERYAPDGFAKDYRALVNKMSACIEKNGHLYSSYAIYADHLIKLAVLTKGRDPFLFLKEAEYTLNALEEDTYNGWRSLEGRWKDVSFSLDTAREHADISEEFSRGY